MLVADPDELLAEFISDPPEVLYFAGRLVGLVIAAGNVGWDLIAMFLAIDLIMVHEHVFVVRRNLGAQAALAKGAVGETTLHHPAAIASKTIANPPLSSRFLIVVK